MESHTKYSLNLENVKSIPIEKYTPDFTFHVDGKDYKTCRFVADLLSPIIRQYHYDDETINEYTINTRKEKLKDEDYFSHFLSLYNFNIQEIDYDHIKQYSAYFLELGNDEEYFRLQQESIKELTPEKVIEYFKAIEKFSTFSKGKYFDHLISYASNNFESLPKNELKTLSISILEEIIKHSNLKLNDEDSLFNFILDLYSNDCQYSVLFEYIYFNNISQKSIEIFINKFNIELLNSSIWNRICQRFLSSSNSIELTERYMQNIVHKEHKEGDEFNGLLRYLCEKTGGNIHDNGTINITSNSIDKFHPKNLVDYKQSNYYRSKTDIENLFICFDMKDRRIQLSSYSIQSYSCNSNWSHLKNWLIEGSNNGNEWFIIDQRKNDQTLNGNKITGTFNVNNELSFFRFIRLRQTGKNWSNSYYTVLYSLEFYGKLQE